MKCFQENAEVLCDVHDDKEQAMTQACLSSCRFTIFGIVALAISLSAGRAAGQAVPRPWRVGIATWSVATAPFWIAADSGQFRRRGLDVELIHVSGDTRAMQTVLAGQLHLAVGGAVGPMRARLGGLDVFIIGSTSDSLHQYIISKPQIAKAEELRGKKIAIAVLGGSSHLAMILGLERLKIGPQEVTFLQVGNSPTRFTALLSGAVDATLVSPPYTLMAQQRGFRVLLPLKDLGIGWLLGAIYGLESTLRAHPQAVRHFLEAVIEGVHIMKTDRARASEIIQRQMRFSKKEELDDAYDRYAHELTNRDLRPSLDGLKTMLSVIAKETPSAARANPSDFVDMRFLEEIYRSPFFQQLYGTNK
jgi:NitT/TauT family transport system substrate-binding protein